MDYGRNDDSPLEGAINEAAGGGTVMELMQLILNVLEYCQVLK